MPARGQRPPASRDGVSGGRRLELVLDLDHTLVNAAEHHADTPVLDEGVGGVRTGRFRMSHSARSA